MTGSWKTTLFGVLAAIAVVVISLVSAGKVTVEEIVIAVCLAIAGYFQKDKDVTGGTRPNK